MEDAEFIKSYEQDIKRLNCKYADEHGYMLRAITRRCRE